MDRTRSLEAVRRRREPYDLIVVGGGATGAGIALDGASRGLDVLLLERADFGAGTSSRSTKIIHGGVRYVAQARFGLVREALRERALLLHNAAHLVRPLPFVVPAAGICEQAKFFAGLKLYDTLAGSTDLDRSQWLTRRETLAALPGLNDANVRGGIRYMDAQFDDARLLIAIVRTAAALGATVVNYCEVCGFDKDVKGRLRGVEFADHENGGRHEIGGRVIVNAAGPYTDEVLALDDPGAPSGIIPSQGAHVVVGAKFFGATSALLMPHTPDKRIMFAIPWHGHVLLGTTDTPLAASTRDPLPLAQEIDMILDVAGRYLASKPRRTDVLSCFAGIRPLARTPGHSVTAQVSREHQLNRSRSGLVTITGGKWTTYRRMAEQCVDFALREAGLPVPPSQTRATYICGAGGPPGRSALAAYGTDAAALTTMTEEHPELARLLNSALPYIGAECIWAVRHEMARTPEDVLARRLRAAFLNAAAAREMLPVVAALMRRELGRDHTWETAQIAACERALERYELARAER